MENRKNEKVKALVLLLFIGCIGVTFMKPLAQDVHYHLFADSRILMTIPNCLNVLSNLPFLIIGILGMLFVAFKSKALIADVLRPHYFIFFLGILLTGIGSSYYHLNPNNNTLVWDRLPMTISFMSFFSVIIGEFIGTKNARLLLFLLLFLGISSVMYWNYTESHGAGDLRMYMTIQFFPMFLIPVILFLFTSPNYPIRYLWMVLVAYVFAKVFETFDRQIFNLVHVSGHSIKHLFAALAPLLFLVGIKQMGKLKKSE